MKKIVAGIIVVVMMAVAAGVVIGADKSQVYYVCNCGDDCKCNSISKEPRTCACGKEMAAAHMLEMEKNTAVLCTCACGKDMKRL